MSERNYYVICDDNCRFESMTKEQIIAAIEEATGETPVHIDDAFITKIKEKNANAPLSFWVGTQAQYNAITEKDTNCFYIITDDTSVEEMQVAMAGIESNMEAVNDRVAVLETIEQMKNVLLWEGTGDIDAKLIDKKVIDYTLVKVYVVGQGYVLCNVFSMTGDTAWHILGTGTGIADENGDFYELHISLTLEPQSNNKYQVLNKSLKNKYGSTSTSTATITKMRGII